MDKTKFGCKFSVLAIPERADVFFMNMRVYDVLPQSVAPKPGSDPVAVIWCAVYNLNQFEPTN